MYKGKLVKYYDDLYHNKDYSKESKFIESNATLNKVLDVGCGTGTHIENLCREDRTFIGIDPEWEILEIANTKFRNHSNVFFNNCYAHEIKNEKDFDTIISMFNVVNHILDDIDLKLYFNSISKLLSKDGTFIFDCFNSNAVVDSNTHKSVKHITSSAHGGEYVIENTTKFNDDTKEMEMNNLVKVFHLEEEVDSFNYSLEHKIWSLDLLKKIIQQS